MASNLDSVSSSPRRCTFSETESEKMGRKIKWRAYMQKNQQSPIKFQ